jgi:hypothetical protein
MLIAIFTGIARTVCSQEKVVTVAVRFSVEEDAWGA